MVGPPHRVSALAWLWLLIVFTGSAGLQGSRSGGALLSQYPGPDDIQLRLAHMAIDQKTRRIYVAGVNVLLQLDPNLNLEHYVVTGPKNDSPLCHSTGCNNPDITLSLMDNFNKVLLLESESRSLILCGSVYQGACSKYKLSNISAEPQFIPISVSANNPTASTYAFIGPAFYNSNWGRANILYVGTTFTNNGEYRHDVPAISSRDLDTLDLAEYSFSKQSQLSIDVKYRDHFIVQYVYGFNASEYAYFVIIQKQSHLPGQEELGYVSRLARTCIDDANYDSYTEVTIQCLNGDTKYNLIQDAKITLAGEQLANALSIDVDSPVLVAAFRPSIGVTNKPQNNSALCVYPLRDIENKFIENIHMCFNGSVKYRNMGYISGPILDGKCPVIGSAGNIPSFCGDVGLKISGMSPISANAALVFPNISLSAVATATTGRHNLLFLGTTDGKIKKVLLNGPKPPEYEEVVVDSGNPILPDTQLSPLSDYLYVLSSTKVSKISVEHCSTYANCSACLESKDPYCGWCSLEKKCTVRRACQKASHSAPRWLSSGQQCIDFEQVLPEQIPFDQMTTVRLTIRTLPELPYGAIYKCVFGQAEPIDAQVTEFGLSCSTPPVSNRPKIPPKMDHILVPLSIRSSETNKDFVSKSFAYYDCGRHVTCGECVKSKWACNWCVYENKCTHNISMCQRNIISGENNPLHLSSHGYKFCPQFKRRDVIYLPNHVLKEITFEVENLPHPQAGHFGFQCIVVIEGATMLVPAKVDADKYIVCDKTTYTYEAAEGEYEATVRVVWNRNHYIDSTNIRLYKCEILGSHREHADCSLCVTRNARYQCTWCGTSCQYNETCVHTPYIECPRPRIDIIKPLFGPIEGGTLITIEGSNLGLKKSDVEGKIRIGDIPCKLVNYEVSVKIQCVSGPSQKVYKAPLIVGNEAGYTQSTIEFTYQDIQLTNVYPPIGPQSGGTLLAIKGKYLNIGSQILAYLDSNICYVNLTQASNGRLTCITSKAPRPMNIARLTLIIDGANRTLEGNPFNYTEDPTIMEIKPLSSFVSGGKMIFVHGSNLDSIQRPEMEVYSFSEPKASINSSVCTVLSSTQMACPSPAVNKAFLSYSSVSRRSLKKAAAIKIKGPKLTLKIGFIMDDVQKMKNLDKHFPNLRSTILYMEDPRFFEFPDQMKLYKGDTLVIEGENLNAASDEADVIVTIGTKMCNVTSLAMTQLVCFPPDLQPEGTDENGVKTDTMLPLVVVNVGQNLRFPIGYLKYDLNKSFNFPPEAFALIAAGITLFGFFFVAVLFLYRRKSTQAEREYKRIQIQMDTLESNVRSECKLAFAELQTDMTDLTADLENSGIPTLDHTAYVMKVFFPGVVNHPILNAIRMQFSGPKNNYDTAVLQFEQLINNKYFLLTFINVLENQKSFSIRNKVNVASLLMVTLMDKMEYATDILKCLLLALIERSVNTKHPQLMLRRTESIVEKMLTNWMALCMYRYLREYAGSSLFLLFNAIKHQVEKGLVDAVTHDARYSLSEERLLRINVEYCPVTLYIVQDDLDEKIHCKVLDCDTISQVKAKILDALFKNTPYSLRPSIYDVDLEWRHGRGGHLILQDEDLTTKTIDGWKRLNTLSHYGVKESAIMSLISRTPNDTYNNCKQPCQNCIAGIYLNDTLQSNTSKIIPNGYVDGPCNPRTYHLIRPVDDHQFQSKFLDRAHKAIPEIFLTRLLSTKGTIEKFVDDFFMAILTVNDALPPAVKWLFDLLDEAAIKYGIQDPEVIQSWKSNSLPLRFWVTFIKNPDFIFDINKTNSLDSCLSVIAQTFMDACSTSEHRLGKDSPSNKLLFAKDIPRYKEMVLKFYADVARLPTVTDQEMGSVMQQLSAQQSQEFDTIAALKELYIYVENYREPILEALSMDPHCWRQHLPQKLENLSFILGEEKS